MISWRNERGEELLFTSSKVSPFLIHFCCLMINLQDFSWIFTNHILFLTILEYLKAPEGNARRYSNLLSSGIIYDVLH